MYNKRASARGPSESERGWGPASSEESQKGKRSRLSSKLRLKSARENQGWRYAVRMRMHRRPTCSLPFAICLLLVVFVSTPASADITAFLGATSTPTARPVKGFAAGMGLLVAGFEVEYASTNEDLDKAAPGLRTFMFNGLVQTPVPIGGLQFYGTAGGGVFRETLNVESETNVGINVGGGVKISLAGPLRLRFDYRIFTLRGSPLHSRPQRFYAGLNLKF